MAVLDEAVIQSLLEALDKCQSIDGGDAARLKALVTCLSTAIRVQNEELRLYEMTFALLRGRDEAAQISLNILDQALKKMTLQKRLINAEEAMRHVQSFRESIDTSRTAFETTKAAATLALKLAWKLVAEPAQPPADSSVNEVGSNADVCK